MLDLNSETEEHAMSTAATRVALPPGFPRRAVRRAIEYIHANLAEGVCLADIAQAAGLSTFHFARLFRKATGVTPYRYCLQARVERVKGLMLESEDGLATIAIEAGFSDQSHMSNVFRRLTGMTPRAFRNTPNVRIAYGSSDVSHPLRADPPQ
jgi:AraC family transcriptional regulator